MIKKIEPIYKNEAVASSYDMRDYRIAASSELPLVYNPPLKTPVKNQGSQPTCVAHACASIVEYHNMKQTDTYEAFSTQFIYGLREKDYYQGDGMCIRDALNTLAKYGDPKAIDCIGNTKVDKAKEQVLKDFDYYKECAYPNRISAYFKLKSEKEMKTAIYNCGPILVSMNTYEGATLVNDVYTYNKEANHGCHCVLIYGWDERGWLVQNSWGVLYGGDGRFVIGYNYKFNEAWGVTDNITDETIKKTKRNKFVNFIYSAVNKIVNTYLRIVSGL